jgi:hypothetical protein
MIAAYYGKWILLKNHDEINKNILQRFSKVVSLL